jgi:hypothetical protein
MVLGLRVYSVPALCYLFYFYFFLFVMHFCLSEFYGAESSILENSTGNSWNGDLEISTVKLHLIDNRRNSVAETPGE